MPKPTDPVLLDWAEYEALLRDSKLLAALHQGGVDNWEWYSESINMYYPEYFKDLTNVIPS